METTLKQPATPKHPSAPDGLLVLCDRVEWVAGTAKQTLHGVFDLIVANAAQLPAAFPCCLYIRVLREPSLGQEWPPLQLELHRPSGEVNVAFDPLPVKWTGVRGETNIELKQLIVADHGIHRFVLKYGGEVIGSTSFLVAAKIEPASVNN